MVEGIRESSKLYFFFFFDNEVLFVSSKNTLRRDNYGRGGIIFEFLRVTKIQNLSISIPRNILVEKL